MESKGRGAVGGIFLPAIPFHDDGVGEEHQRDEGPWLVSMATRHHHRCYHQRCCTRHTFWATDSNRYCASYAEEEGRVLPPRATGRQTN